MRRDGGDCALLKDKIAMQRCSSDSFKGQRINCMNEEASRRLLFSMTAMSYNASHEGSFMGGEIKREVTSKFMSENARPVFLAAHSFS